MNQTTPALTVAVIMTAVQTFVESCQKRIDAHYAANLSNLTPPKLVIKESQRFIRIECHESMNGSKRIFAFVDKIGGVFQRDTVNKPGDILKPATWKAPSKHARGNVLADDNGMSAVYADGGHVRYL